MYQPITNIYEKRLNCNMKQLTSTGGQHTGQHIERRLNCNMKQLTLTVRILLIVALLAGGSVTLVHPTPTMAAVNFVQYGRGFSFYIDINGTDLQNAKVSTTAALNCAWRAAGLIVSRYFGYVKTLAQVESICRQFGLALPPAGGLAITLLQTGFAAKIYLCIRSYAKYATKDLYIFVSGGPDGPTPASWAVRWT
jgi:hypothetical protein